MSVGEVLDLRKSGSGLYIDPSAPDCLEGSTMLAATTSSELYPKGIFYLYDHLGNTRVTFQPSGTSCVNVTNYNIRYLADYYPYGKLLRSWQSSSQEKYLTTQHERDLATGLDFRNARYYDSETMRFYGVDPLAEKYAGWSSFNYVMGNPVSGSDPDGADPIFGFALKLTTAISNNSSGSFAKASLSVGLTQSYGNFSFSSAVNANAYTGGLGTPSSGNLGGFDVSLSGALSYNWGGQAGEMPMYLGNSTSLSSVSSVTENTVMFGQSLIYSSGIGEHQRNGLIGARFGDFAFSSHNDTDFYLGDGGDRGFTGGIKMSLKSGGGLLEAGTEVYTGFPNDNVRKKGDYSTLFGIRSYPQGFNRNLNNGTTFLSYKNSMFGRTAYSIGKGNLWFQRFIHSNVTNNPVFPEDETPPTSYGASN